MFFLWNCRYAVSRAKAVNRWAWHAVQFRRTVCSQLSHSGRTDLVRSLKKTRSKSLARIKKRPKAPSTPATMLKQRSTLLPKPGVNGLNRPTGRDRSGAV